VSFSTHTPVRNSHEGPDCHTEYALKGVGATAPFIIGNILKQDGLSCKYVFALNRMISLSLGLAVFQIGWGYAIGIVLALGICGTTSGGGHINPCITIAFTIFRGFPLKKAPG